MDERGYLRIVFVVGHARCRAVKAQVSAQPFCQLGQSHRRIEIEPVRENTVGDHAGDGDQQSKHHRGNDRETPPQRTAHVGVSVSTYPTPRIVWIRGVVKPRSILLRSELICTSTTLLMLS